MGLFTDRLDAGRQLATALSNYRGSRAIVVGLARGGVVVGFAVARSLDLPLLALVVRKLGAPHNPELAIGAISETGVKWLDPYLTAATGASEAYIEGTVERELAEARRRREEYGTGPRLESMRGRTAIVVDDGLATGATAVAAVRSVRSLGADRVILAAPVASVPAAQLLRSEADVVVALAIPEQFYAVGVHYRNFDQVADADVIRYLDPEAPES